MKKPRGGGNHAEPRSRHNPSSHHHHLYQAMPLLPVPPFIIINRDIISTNKIHPSGRPFNSVPEFFLAIGLIPLDRIPIVPSDRF